MTANKKLTDDNLAPRSDKLGWVPLQKGGPGKRKVTDLLAVLSSPGTLHILELAENGIIARADAHLRTGLSKRQYYARLSQLVRIGLLDKVGGVYLQTRFGVAVYKDYIPRLRDIMDL